MKQFSGSQVLAASFAAIPSAISAVIVVFIAKGSLDLALVTAVGLLILALIPPAALGILFLTHRFRVRLIALRQLLSATAPLFIPVVLLGLILAIQRLTPSDTLDFNLGFEPVPIPTITVGDAAFLTMTAAATELVCGEKATILGTVTDIQNQNVHDGTRADLVTNVGGTLAAPETQGVTATTYTFGGVFTA